MLWGQRPSGGTAGRYFPTARTRFRGWPNFRLITLLPNLCMLVLETTPYTTMMAFGHLDRVSIGRTVRAVPWEILQVRSVLLETGVRSTYASSPSSVSNYCCRSITPSFLWSWSISASKYPVLKKKGSCEKLLVQISRFYSRYITFSTPK
jgi:hypothetical protein